MKKFILVGLAAGAVALAPTAHATPNADRTEVLLTCNLLDKWTPGYSIGQAVQMAPMGIQGDTGMGTDDAAEFLWKSVDDYCPQYRPAIEAARS